MTRTFALTLALLCLAAPCFAGDAILEKVAKHYDPAHVGHSHQCQGCGSLYHQQGDMGPGSPGSNVCPRCGHVNPAPASPQEPSYGMTWTEGRDGVRVFYPSRGFTWTEGRDGRRVVYPSSGWTWTEGRDGRRIVYPQNGWTWCEGRDGVRIVYPTYGWTWCEGRDGRRVAYPSSGWSHTENAYGRAVPYPYGYASGDYSSFLVSYLSQAVPLAPEHEPHRDLMLRQMRILEY